MKKIGKFFKSIFVDNIVITLVSLTLAVVLCLISAIMA